MFSGMKLRRSCPDWREVEASPVYDDKLHNPEWLWNNTDAAASATVKAKSFTKLVAAVTIIFYLYQDGILIH